MWRLVYTVHITRVFCLVSSGQTIGFAMLFHFESAHFFMFCKRCFKLTPPFKLNIFWTSSYHEHSSVYFKKYRETSYVCAFVSLSILCSYTSHCFSSYSTRCEIRATFSTSVTKHPNPSSADLLGASNTRSVLMQGLTLFDFCKILIIILTIFIQAIYNCIPNTNYVFTV